MIELPLILLSGFLGSSHCLGMCGGFALTVGAGATSWRSNLLRQIAWSSGRVFTYAFAGATAGYLGARVSNSNWSMLPLQAGLAIVAGTALLAVGLVSAGVIPWRRRGLATGPCLTGSLVKTFLLAPELTNVFIAGVLTGFLPCGLVYAFVLLAASTGSLWSGALVMVAFGVGTMPALITLGSGGALLSVSQRARVLRVAAWCVVVTGLLTIGRGVAFANQIETANADEGAVECPLCHPPASQSPINESQSE